MSGEPTDRFVPRLRQAARAAFEQRELQGINGWLGKCPFRKTIHHRGQGYSPTPDFPGSSERAGPVRETGISRSVRPGRPGAASSEMLIWKNDQRFIGLGHLDIRVKVGFEKTLAGRNSGFSFGLMNSLRKVDRVGQNCSSVPCNEKSNGREHELQFAA